MTKRKPNTAELNRRFDKAMEAIKLSPDFGPGPAPGTFNEPAPIGYIVESRDGKRCVKEGSIGPRTDTNAATMYRSRKTAESRGKRACGRKWGEYRVTAVYR